MTVLLPPLERKLALSVLWATLAPFGLALILTGLNAGTPIAGAAGFALLVAGFGGHLIINRMAGMHNSEVFFGFRWFWLVVLAFIVLLNVIWVFG